MNFIQLKSDVYSRLEELEGSPVRWSDSDIGGAINEALLELSDATEFYERTFTVKMRKNANYYDLRSLIPEPILRITAVYNPANNVWLTPDDCLNLDLDNPLWEKAAGEPTRWFMRAIWWMGIYPHPTTEEGLLKISCRVLHPELADNQSPQQLPEDYQEALINYAIYTLLSDDRETPQALSYWAKYQLKEAELAAKSFPGGRAAYARISGMKGGPARS